MTKQQLNNRDNNNFLKIKGSITGGIHESSLAEAARWDSCKGWMTHRD